MTPEIDKTEMINAVLDEKSQKQYLDSKRDVLREQARDFYSSIITGVDADAKVEFDFAS